MIIIDFRYPILFIIIILCMSIPFCLLGRMSGSAFGLSLIISLVTTFIFGIINECNNGFKERK